MKNKINIAELLKDFPKGMELYSPIFGKVYLNEIRPHLAIVVTTDKYKEEFLYDGRYGMNGECMLFPSKDNTTWEGIEAPFKDGDIVSTDDGIYTAIVRRVVECEVEDLYNHEESYETYCHIYYEEEDDKACFNIDATPLRFCRLANEEEKEKLFHAIKENGYKWDDETKTLEKLIEPKFKVGDKIKYKGDDAIGRIEKIDNNVYHVDYSFDDGVVYVNLKVQDDYEVVHNKFDITTLKPFDKVLIRDYAQQMWAISFFSHCNGLESFKFSCINGNLGFEQCIPYEGNEHLLGTYDNCDEFYKNWK